MRKKMLEILLTLSMTVSLSAGLFSGFDPGEGAGAAASILAPVLLITGVLVWLLSLTRPGLGILFAAATLICSGAAFLEFPVPVWAYPLFGVSWVTTFLYKNYTITLKRSGCVTRKRPGFFLQSGAVALTALLVAAGIWAGAVRPADPPVRDAQLVRALQQVQLMETLGIYTPEVNSGKSPDSVEEPEQEETTEPAQDVADAETAQDAPDESATADNGQGSYGGAGGVEGFDLRMFWLLLLLPAAVAAAYGLRARSRRKWRDAVEACDPETAARNYYIFLLERFGRMGIEKADEETLRDFAAGSADRTAAFAAKGADFQQLTSIYERLVYGNGGLRPGELDHFRAAYDGFYPALKRKIGKMKYILQYFRY